MPLDPKHIIKFLENISYDRDSTEMLYLLIKRIDQLCSDCEIDRIQCTLTPLCTRRFLLRLRIKNNLTLEDLPKFCYSVLKNVLHRDFYSKTVVYKPFDAYLYLLDFLDVFFHGDYRKLNKFISFKNWEDALKIFNERIERGEDFQYQLTDNYMVFKYADKIHAIFLNENYALCNANRENIVDLEILYALCELYRRQFFPEFKVRFKPSKYVEIALVLPRDVLNIISKEPNYEEGMTKLDDYFWNLFPKDLEALTEICYKISLRIEGYAKSLFIRLYLNIETNKYIGLKKQFSLKFRDLRFMFNFIYRTYDDFYILRLSEIAEIRVEKETRKAIAKEKEIKIEPKPQKEVFEHKKIEKDIKKERSNEVKVEKKTIKKIEVSEHPGKIVVEKNLYKKYENENPGKKAIWRGNETKDFLEWKKNYV